MVENYVTHAYLGSPALPFTIMYGINESSVIPVLNHIVWTIMNLYFNCVSSIVNEEYNAPLPTSDHCWNILSCNLNRKKSFTHHTLYFFKIENRKVLYLEHQKKIQNWDEDQSDVAFSYTSKIYIIIHHSYVENSNCNLFSAFVLFITKI